LGDTPITIFLDMLQLVIPACVIEGFLRGVAETFVLLGRYAAYIVSDNP
jgi:hypothetical protein